MLLSTRKTTAAGLAVAAMFSSSSTVAAENKFSFPSTDMTLYQGDTITVEYVTDYASPKLHIFCYNDEGEGILGMPFLPLFSHCLCASLRPQLSRAQHDSTARLHIVA